MADATFGADGAGGALPRVALWGGWLMALGCILVRVQAALVPFPYWDADPSTMVSPILGLTPATSVLVDVVMMLGAGVALMGHGASGGAISRIHIVSGVLIAVGATGVALHAWVVPGEMIESIRIGATWTGAMIAGLAALVVCGGEGGERVRRLTFALGTGVVMMLAAKGVLQVFIEHPMTVQQFRANREAFLAAQGWAPDSAAARGFERRLNQPEATGWFGMANVYASFAAASFTALLGLAIAAWRQARVRRVLPDGWPGLLTFGAIGAAAAVGLAGGKGGFGAAAVGAAVLLLASLGVLSGRRTEARGTASGEDQRRGDADDRRSWLGGALAVILVSAALAAVAVRGMLGERLGELSLLFRWFYLQGATRIFAENPLLGVGPAGFKDAYLLAKPPLSPEEVTSPHSILFDWAATLGLFGLAWCAVWLIWVWMAGTALTRWSRGSADPQPIKAVRGRGSFNAPEERTDARIVLAVVISTMFVGAWLELAGNTLESLIMRLVGAAAWIGVALAALAVMRSIRWHWIGAAAVIALAVHAQIEVTPIWPGSAALFMVLIASIAAPREAPRPGAVRRSSLRLVHPALAFVLAIAWAWLGLVPVARWQDELASAASAVHPVAEVNERMGRIIEDGPVTADGDSMPHLATDLSSLLGRPRARDMNALYGELDELFVRTAGRAQSHLAAALALSDGDAQTAEALARIMMLRAMAEGRRGEDATANALAEQAQQMAGALAEQRPTANRFGLLGNILAARAELHQNHAYLEAAITAWGQAAELDPYGLTFPLRVYRALERLGEEETERGLMWGGRILRLDEQLRLDPVRQLTAEERSRVKAATQRASGLP
jgi:hypothetical protein